MNVKKCRFFYEIKSKVIEMTVFSEQKHCHLEIRRYFALFNLIKVQINIKISLICENVR